MFKKSTSHSSRKALWIGSIAELSLVGVAVLLGRLLGQSPCSSLRWNAHDVILGVVAVVPLLLLFNITLNSTHGPLVKIKEFLTNHIGPLVEKARLVDFLVLSIFAGVGEELLFRGVLQAAVGEEFGPIVGITVASLVFGLCHSITRAYALIATIIGVYLGYLWLVSGNILVPITTHALYDFSALVLFRRRLPVDTAPKTG